MRGSAEWEVKMLCAELERLEAELDDVITALEAQGLPDWRKQALEREYARISRLMTEHEVGGHSGKPCFELDSRC